jgi:hypothetical protein
MGLMMTMAAFVEFRGQGRLRRLEPSAARTLGYNQIVLGLLIVLYAAWNVNELTTAWPGTIKFDFSLKDESLQFALGHAAFRHQLSLVLYGVMGILAVIIQGSAAWYCFSRDQWIRQYVSFAPSWIVQMQRAGIAL